MNNASSNSAARRPRVSAPIRALAYLFGAALLIYFAGVAVLSSAWFHKILLERARDGLADLTGARVEIGQMQINPWVFQATFRGLVLHGSETSGELPLMVAREVIVFLNPSAALRRQVRLRRLELEGGSIHIYTRSDGSTNLPGPAATQGFSVLDRILDLKISHLLVGQSSFYWNNRRFALDLAARDIALVLGRQKGAYAGSFAASALNLSNSELHWPPLVLSTRIELAADRLRLNSLVWRSPVLSGNGSVSLGWSPTPQSRFSFQLEGDAGSLAKILHRHELREGRFSASGEGTYSSSGIEARGRFDTHRLIILGPALRPLSLDLAAGYSLQGKRVDLARLDATLLGGSVRGKASFSLDARGPNVSADLEVQGVDLASVLGFVPQGSEILADFPLASQLDGNVQVAGSSADVQSRFDLALRGAGSEREPLSGIARGSLQFGRNSGLDLQEAKLDTAHSHLALQGRLGTDSANLNFSLETTAFEEWRPAAESWVQAALPVKLDSTATFTGTASGTSAQAAIRAHLTVGAFEYQRWKWDGFQADVALGPGRFEVSSGRLLGAHSTLALDFTAGLAAWAFTPSSPFQLSARADQTSIEGLRDVLGIAYPLDGVISGGVTVERSRSHVTGRGSFRIVRGSYDGEPFDSLEATLNRTADEWSLAHGELVKGGGRITGDASYNPAARTFSAHAHGSDLALADFRRLQSLRQTGKGPAPAPQITGLLGFDAEAHSSIDNPSAEASITVRQLSLRGAQLGELSSRLDWSQNRAEVHGQLQGSGGELTFRGGGTTAADWPFTVSAQYAGLRLDSLLRGFNLASPGGNIDASGAIDLSGTVLGSAPFKLTTQVQELNVRFADLKWKNDKPFAIALAGRRISLTPFELLGPATRFQVQGTAVLGPASALNLTADGEIDSAFLHLFSPLLLTTGHFDVQAQVRGTLNRPSIYGSLLIHDVSLGYPRLPLQVAGLNGDIDLQGDRVTIRTLRAASGPASITITGGAVLSGTPRYNLRADLSRFRVDYPVQFTSVLSGSIHLSGTPDTGVLSGDLTVAQMFVDQNFNVLNWASALGNQPAIVTGPTPAIASGVRLDVHVASAPVVSVESHDLTAVATIDLDLRGTMSDPVAFGNVHIQSGQAVLRQSNYRLSRGDIILSNPLRTEPVLDLEAKTRIERYDLILRITGPADHPSISYRSDPPLSTPSILALLAFGYTSQDQLIAQTGRSNLSAQGANALLTQALSTQVSSRITRLFGLSRIGVDPNPSSLGGARVTVEEQLRRDFTITYVNTTGGIQERIIQVEWDVSDNISLLGIRDQNGVYGLELDFRHRFK